MFLPPYRRKHDVWMAACARLDPSTARSIEVATSRAATATRNGNLLSSIEAMLMPGPEARGRETLFSIARSTALEIGGDEGEILESLKRRFKSLR